jgi:hypothetical protein
MAFTQGAKWAPQSSGIRLKLGSGSTGRHQVAVLDEELGSGQRLHDLHTIDAAFWSHHVLRNWSTFSSTFSSTWSEYDTWNSMELGPGPAKFRVLLDDSAMSATRRSNGGERTMLQEN